MQVGNYLIEKEIGEGGMSNVYLAKHHRLQKNVAIKILKSEYIKNENIRQRLDSDLELHRDSHQCLDKVSCTEVFREAAEKEEVQGAPNLQSSACQKEEEEFMKKKMETDLLYQMYEIEKNKKRQETLQTIAKKNKKLVVHLF